MDIFIQTDSSFIAMSESEFRIELRENCAPWSGFVMEVNASIKIFSSTHLI